MTLTAPSPAAMNPQALQILRKIVPWLERPGNSIKPYRSNYKGSRGRIGIVGGARDYAGAPYFASMSAMKLGADLGYVICSQAASQALKSYSPDLIVVPILDHPDEETFRIEVSNLVSKLHSVVVGPGLGRDELLQSRALKIIEEAKTQSKSIVLDADGLLLVEKNPAIIQCYPHALLTPNRNELQRLLENLFTPEKFNLRSANTKDVVKLVHRCSSDLMTTILAKGSTDIICEALSEFELLTSVQSGSDRRCGGQGDILCGLAGVYCHWINMFNQESDEKIANVMAWAGFLAAMTTRRSNELAFIDFRNGALASDMIDKIALALESLLNSPNVVDTSDSSSKFQYSGLLTADEVKRYARQIIISEFGATSQIKLKQTSVLIVGAGGLGCPAAIYLGAAGIGLLGVVDDDRVEASNLHRQILHNTNKIGSLKTESIKESVKAVNPHVDVKCHSIRLDRYNAVDLIEQYDIIIDCTDNLMTRYMINDACVVSNKPLISGAALKMDGQLTVYNYDDSTPCFRCLFPKPPRNVGSCNESGVLGVITGIIGINQAMEAIKIGAGLAPSYAGKMLLFDGQLGLYRHITLSTRRKDCASCGDESALTRQLIDYNKFCGEFICTKSNNSSDNLPSEKRVTTQEYKEILESGDPHILVDVRPKEHSDISRFKHAIQLPIKYLLEEPRSSLELIKRKLDESKTNQVFVVCRLGISSQRGAQMLRDLLTDVPNLVVKDIVGGMTEWSSRVDSVHFACV